MQTASAAGLCGSAARLGTVGLLDIHHGFGRPQVRSLIGNLSNQVQFRLNGWFRCRLHPIITELHCK